MTVFVNRLIPSFTLLVMPSFTLPVMPSFTLLIMPSFTLLVMPSFTFLVIPSFTLPIKPPLIKQCGVLFAASVSRPFSTLLYVSAVIVPYAATVSQPSGVFQIPSACPSRFAQIPPFPFARVYINKRCALCFALIYVIRAKKNRVFPKKKPQKFCRSRKSAYLCIR